MRASHRTNAKQYACQVSAASWSRSTLLVLCALLTTTARAQQTDKLLHASASAAIVDVVWVTAAACDQPLPVRIAASVGTAAAVGVGKELVDAAGFGTPDAADLLFDAFGIGLGVAIALVVEALWFEPVDAASGD